MRWPIVFVLLLASAGLFVVLQVTRASTPHAVTVAAAPLPKAKSAKDQASKGKASKGPASRPSKGSAGAPIRAPGIRPGRPETGPIASKPPEPRIKRPLRVTALGWELATPGVVANDGAKPGKASLFAKERLQVELSASEKLGAIEAALARGGQDPLGADVAILPLPELVAAYDRLRALEPKILFIVGWSRGRHGLLARPGSSLRRPPYTATLVGRPGEAATLLGAWLLNRAGVARTRIKLVDAASKQARRARFAASERPRPANLSPTAKFLATTADARFLIPIVAVAPAGFIKAHGDALTVWGHVWLQGIEAMSKDVPAAARKVSALPGGPHALQLLQRLGQIQPASLQDNARLAGLSGRSPLDLASLFRRFWKLWRDLGVLSTPPPDQAPLSAKTLSALIRSYPALVEAVPPDLSAAARKKAGPRQGTDEERTLLSYRPKLRGWDQQRAVERLGRLAAIFDRAKLRVSVRDNLWRARKLVAATRARYDLKHPELLEARARKEGRLLQIDVVLVD